MHEMPLTNELDGKGRDVQQKQSHIEEVEERFDVGQRCRVFLEAGKGDINRARAHTNGELQYRYRILSPAWHSLPKQRTTHRLPTPAVNATREGTDFWLLHLLRRKRLASTLWERDVVSLVVVVVSIVIRVVLHGIKPSGVVCGSIRIAGKRAW